FVPSMLKAFLTDVKYKQVVSRLSSLNYVLASGEALIAKITNEFKNLIGNTNQTVLVNLYGPTETSIEVISHPITYQLNGDETGSIPIGKPINNTQIYILQDNMI
ncbi:AMP-binding protein, partial [Staphylococcus capitis]|uniref:AMP-binding protein n=1 Tax=Staphylococcus capitis TaxID=29388 RepID=UPI00301847A3